MPLAHRAPDRIDAAFTPTSPESPDANVPLRPTTPASLDRRNAAA